MRLIEAQWLFSQLAARLILEAYRLGCTVTLGEAWRPHEMARLYAQRGSGSLNSLHIDRLAIDLNLFRDGQWLQASEDHAELGAWWKAQHPLARWGGDFRPKPDGNHYSVEWQGRK